MPTTFQDLLRVYKDTKPECPRVRVLDALQLSLEANVVEL